MPKQIDLFRKTEALKIPGATYMPEFISVAEESDLISHIETGTWTHEFARRRQHYGIGYGTQDWTKVSPLPPWIEMIALRIISAGFFSKMPIQALVNEYEP